MSNMNSINQVSIQQASVSIEQNKLHKHGNTHKESTTSIKYQEVNIAATYTQAEEIEKVPTYTVDMEKVIAMKEETDQRMLDLFRDTAKGTGLKQLGGIRGILDKIRNGEEVTLEIEYTAEDVEKAKAEVAPGGYWSAEKTSDRLIDFAKALSGGNSEKADMLKDSFEKAFKEIEEMFGGTLPDLSYETFDLTMEKFDSWSNGESTVVE